MRQAPDVSALVESIRPYPSGTANELARARLNRLLADAVPKAASALPAPKADADVDGLADRLLAQGQALPVAAPSVPADVAPPGAPSSATPAIDAPSAPATPCFGGQDTHLCRGSGCWAA